MTDPRWTVDDEGLVRWRGLHAIAALNEDNDDCFEAYDALVAAVHDADTLHQARQLVQQVRGAIGRGEFDIANDAESKLYALILSPPVSPDTPTPTGQT